MITITKCTWQIQQIQHDGPNPEEGTFKNFYNLIQTYLGGLCIDSIEANTITIVIHELTSVNRSQLSNYHWERDSSTAVAANFCRPLFSLVSGFSTDVGNISGCCYYDLSFPFQWTNWQGESRVDWNIHAIIFVDASRPSRSHQFREDEQYRSLPELKSHDCEPNQDFTTPPVIEAHRSSPDQTSPRRGDRMNLSIITAITTCTMSRVCSLPLLMRESLKPFAKLNE